MTFAREPYDVVIVGYGPVAEVLAVMLGRRGRRVAIVERWTERYALPRAVCIDHEMYRMLSQIGMGEELPKVSHAGPAYRWFNADWRELLSIDWSAESISGGPEVNFIHQPTLEGMFDTHVRQIPNVEVHLGYEAVSASQADEHATLTVEERATGERMEVSGRYLIGCDGANSIVRQTIDGGQEDRGFEADWLVIDILPHEGVELDVPPAAQWCNPARPTTIVPAGVRDGRYYRRWEFMRLPHETIQDIENEEAAWRLLEPWVRPDQATMVRHKVYTFRSLLANRWRHDRMLIAGDAAHVMPPFMGQGMCAGLRDDWNLAWKLDLVLDGKAEDSLLDTYQVERFPHVSDVIDLSMYLGRMICQPDPDKAAERDAAFFDGTAEPPPAFPHLTDGILQRNADGTLAIAAGLLSPHGRVRMNGREGRLDDLTGGGFVLIVSHSDMLDLPPVAAKLGIKAVALAGPARDERVIEDLDGKIGPFMAEHDLSAMLVRPDYYIYGGAQAPGDIACTVTSLGFALPLIHERAPASASS
jgi:2-polyprenyl-6-methoxyphenol hydroxylase-like FAD-dependent oxidoreductase